MVLCCVGADGLDSPRLWHTYADALHKPEGGILAKIKDKRWSGCTPVVTGRIRDVSTCGDDIWMHVTHQQIQAPGTAKGLAFLSNKTKKVLRLAAKVGIDTRNLRCHSRTFLSPLRVVRTLIAVENIARALQRDLSQPSGPSPT